MSLKERELTEYDKQLLKIIRSVDKEHRGAFCQELLHLFEIFQRSVYKKERPSGPHAPA